VASWPNAACHHGSHTFRHIVFVGHLLHSHPSGWDERARSVPNQPLRRIMLPSCIREVPSSNISCLEIYRAFPQHYLELGHGRFLPRSFRLIILLLFGAI
jgi:hypothetical protein